MSNKISGKYNEYGYVVYLDGKPVYAAGNSPHDSQGYLGVTLSLDGGNVKKNPKYTFKADALSLAEIECDCRSTVESMADYPALYSPTEHLDADQLLNGGVKYATALNLNPRGIAIETGDMPVEYARQADDHRFSGDFKKQFKAY